MRDITMVFQLTVKARGWIFFCFRIVSYKAPWHACRRRGGVRNNNMCARDRSEFFFRSRSADRWVCHVVQDPVLPYPENSYLGVHPAIDEVYNIGKKTFFLLKRHIRDDLRMTRSPTRPPPQTGVILCDNILSQ